MCVTANFSPNYISLYCWTQRQRERNDFRQQVKIYMYILVDTGYILAAKARKNEEEKEEKKNEKEKQ